jgi:hypothetical protein
MLWDILKVGTYRKQGVFQFGEEQDTVIGK